MQNLINSQGIDLLSWMKADRQWKRENRIGYARLMLKFAWAKEDKNDIAFYRAVIKANMI